MQGCYFTHLRAAAHFLQHLTCNDDGTELVRREVGEAGEPGAPQGAPMSGRAEGSSSEVNGTHGL